MDEKFDPTEFIKRYGDNYNTASDPRYNKDGWHLSHFFGDKRHFIPWYDVEADYNTNAKSYYDYLGFRIAQLDAMLDAINFLLRKNIDVQDTNSVHMVKLGDWLKGDDLIKLESYVKLSQDLTNALKDTPNGLYVKDLEPELRGLAEQLRQLSDRLDGDESDIRSLKDGLNGINKRLNNIEKEIKSILDRLNGKYKTIPSQFFVHSYYNGSGDVPTGWGTFHAGAIYGQNSVTLNVRIPYANHNLQNLQLNGGALPLDKTPASYVVGFGFTGDYSFLNDMKIESVQITNGAPHIEPSSARASWQFGYNIDHKNSVTSESYAVTLATFADGYNDKDTLKEHYSGISLKGDILTATLTLSGAVPAKFWNGSDQEGTEPDEPDQPEKPDQPDEPDQPEKPDEPEKPEKPDEPEKPVKPDEPDEPSAPKDPTGSDDKIIHASPDDPQGVPDLIRDITRTINFETNED